MHYKCNERDQEHADTNYTFHKKC